MFNMSSTLPTTDYRFQQSTPLPAIEAGLGRLPNENEIEDAINEVAFSVDNEFCPICEERFTVIENNFLDTILPKLRSIPNDTQLDLEINSNIDCRAFILLQFYRSSIVTDSINCDEESLEALRVGLNGYIDANEDKETLYGFPITMYYLKTLGPDENFTQNLVGFGSTNSSVLIYMNDLIFQLFVNPENVKFDSHYGLANIVTYKSYINYQKQDYFIVKILNDDQRLQFLKEINLDNKGREVISWIVKIFVPLFHITFQHIPTQAVIDDYLSFMTEIRNEEENIYTKEVIRNRMQEYFQRIIELNPHLLRFVRKK